MERSIFLRLSDGKTGIRPGKGGFKTQNNVFPQNSAFYEFGFDKSKNERKALPLRCSSVCAARTGGAP